MTTAFLEELELPTSQDSGDDVDTTHLYCCVEDLALCGLDLSEAFKRDHTPGHEICIVCDLLSTCSTCGKVFEL